MSNTWTKLRALMDAVPEEKRRLLAYDAWNSRSGCGCFFGTLYPDTPRYTDHDTRMNYIGLANDDRDDYGEYSYGDDAPQFHKWMAEIGLTRENVRSLQQKNDQDPRYSSQERWRIMYEYVTRREREFTA